MNEKRFVALVRCAARSHGAHTENGVHYTVNRCNVSDCMEVELSETCGREDYSMYMGEVTFYENSDRTGVSLTLDYRSVDARFLQFVNSPNVHKRNKRTNNVDKVPEYYVFMEDLHDGQIDALYDMMEFRTVHDTCTDFICKDGTITLILDLPL